MPASSRYFFVAEPVELKVLQVPKSFHPKLPLHPEKPERGFREYTVAPEGNDKAVSFWISKKDAETMETGKSISDSWNSSTSKSKVKQAIW